MEKKGQRDLVFAARSFFFPSLNSFNLIRTVIWTNVASRCFTFPKVRMAKWMNEFVRMAVCSVDHPDFLVEAGS